MIEENGTGDAFVINYRRQALKKILLFVSCAIIMVIAAAYISVSYYPSVSPGHALKLIFQHITGVAHETGGSDWWADRYIWKYALPKILAAIIAGCGLAAAGSLMQSVMNNPLADPYSTGISSGACLGAVSAIIVGVTFATAGGYGIVVNAFIGAMVPATIIIILAKRIHMTPATLILAGTALSYFFNALTTYFMALAEEDQLKTAYLWQVGNFSNISWDVIPIMAVIVIIGSIIVFLMSRQLNIMSLGDHSAKSLGLDVERFRLICLILMAIMTAGIVAFTGILGFIGLVAPHIVRLVVGSDNRFVLPIAMTVGATLLLIADYIAEVQLGIAVGVVVSIIGSPIFFYLIVRKKQGGGRY